MTVLNESSCRRGVAANRLFSADEARMIKRILNTLSVQEWDLPYTQVDRSDASGAWVIYIPKRNAISTDNYMFHVTAAQKLDANGEPALDGGDPVWKISANAGTAQPLFGTIQSITGLTDEEVTIGASDTALVYLTYEIYDTGTSSYTHAFETTLTVSTTFPTDSWHTKYFALATIDTNGSVLVGHEGAVYLPSPKSVVDVDEEAP